MNEVNSMLIKGKVYNIDALTQMLTILAGANKHKIEAKHLSSSVLCSLFRKDILTHCYLKCCASRGKNILGEKKRLIV